jgi:hypothetical protein
MSAPTPTFHPPASSATRRRGRVLGFSIASAVTAVIALGFLAVGGALLYLDVKKDEDGYYTTSSERFDTSSYAITSGNLDVDLDGAEELVDDTSVGRVRLHAESNDDKPVFVGIARSADVARYLHGTAHTTVTDIDDGPFGASFDPTYRDSRGDGRPAPPAERDIWTASVSGTGEQSLEWKVRDGDWSVVVMNADASRGVDASLTAGAKLPFVAAVGWTSLGVGAFGAVAAAALLLLGFRGPRGDRPDPIGVGASHRARDTGAASGRIHR